MKFSEIDRDNWPQLRPFLDTALLPLSGLTGRETPFDATEALERLRDALDPLETAFRGRVVTVPALHYAEDDDALARLADELCLRLRESGFAYCVVVAGDKRLAGLRIPNASALISPEEPNPDEPSELYRSKAQRLVESLWHGKQE